LEIFLIKDTFAPAGTQNLGWVFSNVTPLRPLVKTVFESTIVRKKQNARFNVIG
jgi:hypothetical protein